MRTQVTLQGFTSLRQLKNLSSLSYLTPEMPDYEGAVKKIASAFPKVDTLFIEGKDLNGQQELIEAEGIAPLREFHSLIHLGFGNLSFAPGALGTISRLNNLKELDITDRSVFPAGELKGLANCRSLTSLIFSSSKADDETTKALANVKGLHLVGVQSTGISDEAVAALQKALPNCKILR
jgi:hypothetical protein